MIPRDEVPILLRVYFADLTARMRKAAFEDGATEWQLLQLERRLQRALDGVLRELCPRF